MFDDIVPFLKEKSDYLILHVGTNDAPNHSSAEIIDKLLKLKDYDEYISLNIVRADSMKAGSVVKMFRSHLLNLKINVIDHDTSIVKHL